MKSIKMIKEIPVDGIVTDIKMSKSAIAVT